MDPLVTWPSLVQGWQAAHLDGSISLGAQKALQAIMERYEPSLKGNVIYFNFALGPGDYIVPAVGDRAFRALGLDRRRSWLGLTHTTD